MKASTQDLRRARKWVKEDFVCVCTRPLNPRESEIHISDHREGRREEQEEEDDDRHGGDATAAQVLRSQEATGERAPRRPRRRNLLPRIDDDGRQSAPRARVCNIAHTAAAECRPARRPHPAGASGAICRPTTPTPGSCLVFCTGRAASCAAIPRPRGPRWDTGGPRPRQGVPESVNRRRGGRGVLHIGCV